MNLIEEFSKRRRELLRPPCASEQVGAFFGKYGSFSSRLPEMYEAFDGEVFWGALLPGIRINSLSEVEEIMTATSDSWEWLEDERGALHFMRDFLPFLSTSTKSCIGPIFSEKTVLHGCVVEYRYESGGLRVLSKGINDFMEGIFGLSINLEVPSEASEVIKPYVFSPADIEYLARWPSLSVKTETELYIADI